jgi:hypothetical protein
MEKENEFFFWVGIVISIVAVGFFSEIPIGGACGGGCGHSCGGGCGSCPRLTYIAPLPSFGGLFAVRSII